MNSNHTPATLLADDGPPTSSSAKLLPSVPPPFLPSVPPQPDAAAPPMICLSSEFYRAKILILFGAKQVFP